MMKSATVVTATLAILAASAGAVRPSVWSLSSEKEFSTGKTDSLVVTSLGEVRLSQKIDVLVKSGSAPEAISAIAVIGKKVFYASAAGPEVFVLEGGKSRPLANVPGTIVTAMVADGKDLLVGTGGKGAGLYRLGQDGTIKRIWSDEAVSYVWAILRGPDKSLLLGTGPKATVYRVTADGKASALYTVAEKLAKNVMSLALRADDKVLYAGTDRNGLVFAINLADGTARVVLDAAEQEISDMIADEKGGLYVATSDVSKAGGDDAVEPTEEEVGRAAPADVADEAPGEPDPEPVPDGGASGEATTAPADDSARGADGDDRAMPDGTPELPAPPAGDDETIAIQGLTAEASGASGGGEAPEAAEAESAEPRAEPSSGPSEGGPSRPMRRAGSSGRAGGGDGNAVYYIQPDGLVTTVFRKPLAIFAMVRRGDRLILGTGNGGAIFQVTIDGDEIVQLANTEAKQVTALAVDGDGQLLFATANAGSLGVVSSDYAGEGTLTTKVFDAKQVAQWGTVRAWTVAPIRTNVMISTRSGNVADADDKTWSAWSKEAPADGFTPIASPAARFLQVRLRLTGPGEVTPVLRKLQMIYQVSNLAPVVAAVKVDAATKPDGSSEGGPKTYRVFEAQAKDPNGDPLKFTYAYRQVGHTEWVLITDKAGAKYVWDARTAGDGTYEVRVQAADDAGNPGKTGLSGARLSAPFTVDLTAPRVKQLAAKTGKGSLELTGQAVDSGSRIVSIVYSINTENTWKTVTPADGIIDSDDETFSAAIDDLEPGRYRIAVRVTDLYGNVGYGTVSATVGK